MYFAIQTSGGNNLGRLRLQIDKLHVMAERNKADKKIRAAIEQKLRDAKKKLQDAEHAQNRMEKSVSSKQSIKSLLKF